MDINKTFAILAGVAMATTLVLPGRITPQVLGSGGSAVAKIFQSVTGQRVAA